MKNFVFQYTHPRGVRQNRYYDGQLEWSFNTRTRAGCDTGVRIETWMGIEVSIHAPARGATFDDSSEVNLL